MADANSPDEWLKLVKQCELMANFALSDSATHSRAYHEAGFAIEYALKAYIMKKEGLNGWPDRSMRKDLYTHNLRELIRIAGIKINVADKTAAAWKLAIDWDRNQGYDPRPMPLHVAKGWVEAAFGKDGVVTWLRANLI